MLENRSDQIAGTQGRTQDLELGGGGGGGGGQVAYPGYEKWEALQVRYTKSGGGGGGGGGASGPIYEKWGGGGGGGGRFRSDIRKVGGGGHSASDTFGRTENIYMYLPTCYLGILHTRARMNTCRQRFCHPYAVRGGVRPPRPPP